MAFVYMGFTQNAGIRSFQFEHTIEIAARKTTRVAVVIKADLTELMTAHVSVQDGPALCLHVLTGLLADTGGSPLPLVHTITTEEVAAFMRLRTGRAKTVSDRRRRRPKPSSASQLQWPRRA